MALTKRGKYWHYDFIYRGKRYQGSTDQTNRNKAKLTEAKVRSDAALEFFGITQPKAAPLLKQFLEESFLSYVRQHEKKPRTTRFYEEHVRRLLKFPPFTELRLSQVDEQLIAAYTSKDAVATINGDLRTLRKALNLALEWRLISRKVKVRTLPGERQRDFVLTAELEMRYLELAAYPLKQAAILILDLGLRPEECVRLRKADIDACQASVRDGKSKNAARALPLTKRALGEIETLCELWPDSEWLFPGRCGHLNRTSLDNLHAKLRKDHDLPKEFVLYSLRHTFATRLAESGASPFDIKAALGHSSVTVSQRYIHPTGDHLRLALAQKERMDRFLRGEVHEETPEESSTSS